jgi:hypothetical protein
MTGNIALSRISTINAPIELSGIEHVMTASVSGG